MATLQELMAECLGDTSEGQTKQASATKTSTDEIDEVLANLGLDDSETVKTASESTENTQNGGSMKLMDIYEQIMSEGAPAAEQNVEKTASEQTEESTHSSAFGELVGEYFNEMASPYFSKIAGDLEQEAGEGHSPMSGLHAESSLGKTIGKESDPHLSVNYKMENGKRLDVTTGGKSPYSLKEKALLKAILSRSEAVNVGKITE